MIAERLKQCHPRFDFQLEWLAIYVKRDRDSPGSVGLLCVGLLEFLRYDFDLRGRRGGRGCAK